MDIPSRILVSGEEQRRSLGKSEFSGNCRSEGFSDNPQIY